MKLASARDAVPGVEFCGAGRRALARAIETAAAGFLAGAQKDGAEWFGHELQRSWLRQEHQTRESASDVLAWEFECDVDGVQATLRARFMASVKESDGSDRPRLRESGARCEATFIAQGLESAGTCSVKVDGPTCEIGEMRRVALSTLRRAARDALPGLTGTPEFKAARAAAGEARRIGAFIGGAGLARSAGSRRAL